MQGGHKQLVALFTFVARDGVTHAPHGINQVQPQTQQERSDFQDRQRVAEERRAARAQQSSGLTKGRGEGRAGARGVYCAGC